MLDLVDLRKRPAYRDVTNPYGFATFDVDPHATHDTTTITVTHYGAAAGAPPYLPVDSFTLVRPSHRNRGGFLGGHGEGPHAA